MRFLPIQIVRPVPPFFILSFILWVYLRTSTPIIVPSSSCAPPLSIDSERVGQPDWARAMSSAERYRPSPTKEGSFLCDVPLFHSYCFLSLDKQVLVTKFELGLSFPSTTSMVCKLEPGGHRNLKLDEKHPNTWLLVRPSRALPRLIWTSSRLKFYQKGFRGRG